MKNRISSSVEDSIQEYFSRLIFENEELEKYIIPTIRNCGNLAVLNPVMWKGWKKAVRKIM